MVLIAIILSADKCWLATTGPLSSLSILQKRICGLKIFLLQELPSEWWLQTQGQMFTNIVHIPIELTLKGRMSWK